MFVLEEKDVTEDVGRLNISAIGVALLPAWDPKSLFSGGPRRAGTLIDSFERLPELALKLGMAAERSRRGEVVGECKEV